MKLNGKTALVTGAADRIGAAIAVSLAEEGAGIIIHYNSSEKKAAETAQKIKNINAQCITSHHDLSVTSKTKKWFRNLMEKTGGIDILVNSASLYTRDSYFDISEKEINYSMKIHFYSPLIMIREMYKHHRERAEHDNTGNISFTPKVINILDTRLSGPDPLHASYHIGKSALLNLTRELSFQTMPYLSINAVSPGIILPHQSMKESTVEKLKESNLYKKWGVPEDVADAVVFLAESSFITGEVIHVDGGRHLIRGRNV